MDKNNDKLKGIIKSEVYNNRSANQEIKTDGFSKLS
jgi:hypothetical protein